MTFPKCWLIDCSIRIVLVCDIFCLDNQSFAPNRSHWWSRLGLEPSREISWFPASYVKCNSDAMFTYPSLLHIMRRYHRSTKEVPVPNLSQIVSNLKVASALRNSTLIHFLCRLWGRFPVTSTLSSGEVERIWTFMSMILHLHAQESNQDVRGLEPHCTLTHYCRSFSIHRICRYFIFEGSPYTTHRFASLHYQHS